MRLTMNNDGDHSIANYNFLSVDNLQRPRANSDPGIFTLPEIVVQDCSAGESVTRKLSELDDGYFGANMCIRPRSHTCPEDLFRQRSERPGTPPPVLEKRHNRHRFTYISPSKTCVSFAHHNLSRISEDEGPETVTKCPKKRYLNSNTGKDDFRNKFDNDFKLKLNLKETRMQLSEQNS